jgi:Fe2+ transport system protein FeoA
MITIDQAPLGKRLFVSSFREDEQRDFSEIESRLMLLGIVFGQSVTLVKKSLMSRGPLLIEVRGRRIALSQNEAILIKVEVEA